MDPTSSETSELRVRFAAQSPTQQYVRSAVLNLSGVAVRSVENSDFEAPGAIPFTIDLVGLSGSDTHILDVFSVASGRYDAVRLDIQQINIKFLNGTQFNAVYSVPHLKEMIVETTFPVIVDRGRKADVVVDFDLMRSIKIERDLQAFEGVTGINITPVGRLVDLASSGQVSGSIKHDNGTPSDRRDDVPLLSHPITLFQLGSRDTVSVYTDDVGQFSAYFIPAGSYTMQGSSTDSTGGWSTGHVEVTTASTTRKDIIIIRR